ncbi:hypothetical protein GCM10010260_44300 [Streptomyces filipinensis]|uniref:Secreted protein n=1 Tax=Streptomyces filipinensis TaxID=66887 RepID=A0A918IE34_9ACTN|nr:hypothetical protein [Streptomyces filipinensis]GGV02587.1 hypothetical protein GCM10010260_44300 [Streptomyces filipinensis]
MTPWLRITFPCARLLLVLAAALPAYGTVPLYATVAYAAEPPAGFAAPGHPHRAATADEGRPGRAEHTEGSASAELSADARSGGAGAEHPDPPGHRHGHQGPVTATASRVPMPTDSASASYRPVAVEPSRAGSRAGEGRLRPGRPDGPAAAVEGDDDPVTTRAPDSGRPEEPETADLPTVTPSASAVPDQAGLDPTRTPAQSAAAQQSGDATEPVLQLLPLGSGLVLIGLGLGLAFLALRLRRG